MSNLNLSCSSKLKLKEQIKVLIWSVILDLSMYLLKQNNAAEFACLELWFWETAFTADESPKVSNVLSDMNFIVSEDV